MVKFKSVGDFKNVRNVGNVKAPAELKNGFLVTYDRVKGTIALPTATTAKKELWLVMNEKEPVEFVGSTDDYVIATGEFTRIFDTATMKDVVLEINDTILATDYSTITVGDTLVANANGKFEKSSEVTGYTVTFTVLAKTGYAGNGLEISVNV